jgi:hypothetical protein
LIVLLVAWLFGWAAFHVARGVVHLLPSLALRERPLARTATVKGEKAQGGEISA